MTALKKRLHSPRGIWVDELLGVLSAYSKTSRKPIGVSQFTLIYGIEAITPIEIGMPTLRIEVPRMANTEAISKDLDMADELREAATIRIASYQPRMANLYNKHVKSRAFGVEDLVLRKVFENKADPEGSKFQPNWEGPYMIIRVGPAGCTH